VAPYSRDGERRVALTIDIIRQLETRRNARVVSVFAQIVVRASRLRRAGETPAPQIRTPPMLGGEAIRLFNRRAGGFGENTFSFNGFDARAIRFRQQPSREH